jgi:hypothetical protein
MPHSNDHGPQRQVGDLHVWPGGFHAFDLIAPGSALARAALEVQLAWLRRITGC